MLVHSLKTFANRMHQWTKPIKICWGHRSEDWSSACKANSHRDDLPFDSSNSNEVIQCLADNKSPGGTDRTPLPPATEHGWTTVRLIEPSALLVPPVEIKTRCFFCFVTALYIFQCVKGLTVVSGRSSLKNLHRLQHRTFSQNDTEYQRLDTCCCEFGEFAFLGLFASHAWYFLLQGFRTSSNENIVPTSILPPGIVVLMRDDESSVNGGGMSELIVCNNSLHLHVIHCTVCERLKWRGALKPAFQRFVMPRTARIAR